MHMYIYRHIYIYMYGGLSIVSLPESGHTTSNVWQRPWPWRLHGTMQHVVNAMPWQGMAWNALAWQAMANDAMPRHGMAWHAKACRPKVLDPYLLRYAKNVVIHWPVVCCVCIIFVIRPVIRPVITFLLCSLLPTAYSL